MAEFKYALKTLIAAILVVLCLQIKVGGLTMEDHAENWLRTSSLPRYLQKVADGATLALHNAGKAVAGFTNKALGSSEGQRASRLGLHIERSAAALGKTIENEKSPSAVDGDSN